MGRPGLPCNGQSREIRTVHAGKACLYRIAKVHCFSPGSTANMNVSVARSLDAKQLILSAYRNFKKESQLKKPLVSWSRTIDRTCMTLGICKRTLRRVLQEDKGEISATQHKEQASTSTKSRDSTPGLPDSFDRGVIRRKTLTLLAENKTVTLKSLQQQLAKDDLELSKIKLWKTLHALGFRYGKPGQKSKELLVERKDLQEKRTKFLRKIRTCREEKKPIFYLDETWVDTHCYPGTQWLAPEGEPGRKLPASRGQRFVILHCGSSQTGFLPDCKLVFQSKSTDGRDYHSEMNGNIFFDWVANKLTPSLPPSSVVVMDNASYHTMHVEGTKAPTSATKKADMVRWLEDRNLSFSRKATKPALYRIIQAHKTQEQPTYRVDQHLSDHGHEVVRLPPYHCELNPIELIWGDLKQFVAQNNTTFKKADVEELIQRGFQRITADRWKNACKHVEELEENWWRRDNVQSQPIQPVIISLSDSDSDTDTASDWQTDSDTDQLLS